MGKKGGQVRARWESHDERWGEQAGMGGGVGEPGREVGGRARMRVGVNEQGRASREERWVGEQGRELG